MLKAAWDFPNLYVSEDLVVQQGEPRVKLLDTAANFIHQTAAMARPVKQQILSKERSSVCREHAVYKRIPDPCKPRGASEHCCSFQVELSFSLLL